MSEVGGWERFSRCLTTCGVASCALLVVRCLLVRLVADVAGTVAHFFFFLEPQICGCFVTHIAPSFVQGLLISFPFSFLVSQGEVRASRV